MAGNVRVVAESLEEVPAPEPRPPHLDLVTRDDLAKAVAHLEEVGLAAAALQTLPEPEPPKVVIKRVLPEREVLAAMSGLGAVLAVRLMLALAVTGAFVLAYQAMAKPTSMAIFLLCAYAATTVVPLTYLATKRT